MQHPVAANEERKSKGQPSLGTLTHRAMTQARKASEWKRSKKKNTSRRPVRQRRKTYEGEDKHAKTKKKTKKTKKKTKTKITRTRKEPIHIHILRVPVYTWKKG